jgi:hypothetical protein
VLVIANETVGGDHLFEVIEIAVLLREGIRRMHEQNPMLGLRGLRLGIVKPGLYAMQVRALVEAEKPDLIIKYDATDNKNGGKIAAEMNVKPKDLPAWVIDPKSLAHAHSPGWWASSVPKLATPRRRPTWRPSPRPTPSPTRPGRWAR